MHKSKLFTLLKGLKKEEIRWFTKFLASPFHNSDTQCIQLFDYIRKYHPDLDSPKLDKEVVCKKLFPKEPFNVQKLRKVMHKLTLLTEDFLVEMRLREQPYQKKRLLVSELGKRNVYDLFKKGTEELQEELEALPYRDAFYYKEIFELNRNYYSHPETNKQKTEVTPLKVAVEHLDSYFLLQKQLFDFELKGRAQLFLKEKNVKSLEQTKAVLQKEPIFKLYKLISTTFSAKNKEAIYLEIETLFKQELEQLSKNDQLNILQILLNYFGIQMNKGGAEYQAKLLSLYKFGLKKELLIKNGQLSETTFVNISTIGILEKQFSWTERFMENYQKMLFGVSKYDAINLSKSLLFFHQKTYTKAIDLLHSYTFTKTLYLLNAKTVLLRAYFEQFLIDESYFDLVEAQTLAFEKLLRRHSSISDSKKEVYFNFSQFVRKTAHSISNGTLDQKLIEKLHQCKNVALKHWLNEKMTNALNKKGKHSSKIFPLQ